MLFFVVVKGCVNFHEMISVHKKRIQVYSLIMTDDFFVLAQTNIHEFDIEQLTKEKKKCLKATEMDAEARAVLVKRSFSIQTSGFDSLNKTELDCVLR